MSKGPGEKDALTIALKFLSSRPRSIKEVRDRLGDKGFGAEETDKTLQDLEAAGYLDDEKFAAMLAGSRVRYKNWGPLKIRNELAQKGVAKDIAERALEGLKPGATNRAAQEALRKWIKRNGVAQPFDRKISLKAYRFLLSRGFPSPLVMEILKKTGAGSEQPPEEGAPDGERDF